MWALFSMLIIRQVVRAIAPEPGTALVLARELCMFVAAGVLLWVVSRGEHLPLRSVGIGTAPLWKSLLWGAVICVACLAPAVAIALVTGYGKGPSSQGFAKLPLWLVFLTVVRAGVVEELFYRGYAIERMRLLGAGKYLSWGIPLMVFAGGHWTGGLANIGIALVLGGVLTGFYLWKRDLVANMFGHFLVDFVTNVLPALFGAK